EVASSKSQVTSEDKTENEEGPATSHQPPATGNEKQDAEEEEEVSPFLEEEETSEERIPFDLPREEKFVFYSKEMAKVYESQGKYRKAVDIYGLILRENPDDEDIKARIRELNEIIAKQEFDEKELAEESKDKDGRGRAEVYEKINEDLLTDKEDKDSYNVQRTTDNEENEEKEIQDTSSKLQEEDTEEEKEEKEIQDTSSKLQEKDKTHEATRSTQHAEKPPATGGEEEKPATSKKAEEDEENPLAGFVSWMNKQNKDDKNGGK
ncbi:MAG: hypothetical protein SVK54_08190, partial [candidate division WOR-3 bacterium]|nr:hypothetical protein [candidate division WOR-3 bacterium]